MVKCSNGSDVDFKKLEEFEASTDFDNLPNDRSIKCFLACMYQEFKFLVPGAKSFQFGYFVGIVGQMKDFEREIFLKMGSGCQKTSRAKDRCEAAYNYNVCMKRNDNDHYYGYHDFEWYKRKTTYVKVPDSAEKDFVTYT